MQDTEQDPLPHDSRSHEPAVRGPRRRVRIPGMAIAALALIVLAVGGLAPALTTYLEQRQQIADTSARIAEQKAELRSLDAQVARWDDPAYVRAQAGSRLFYVLPGTRAYRVINSRAAAATADTIPAATAREERTPWTSTLLDSFVAAGTTTATPAQLAPTTPTAQKPAG